METVLGGGGGEGDALKPAVGFEEMLGAAARGPEEIPLAAPADALAPIGPMACLELLPGSVDCIAGVPAALLPMLVMELGQPVGPMLGLGPFGRLMGEASMELTGGGGGEEIALGLAVAAMIGLWGLWRWPRLLEG